jgi:ATP-dependent helicase HepA
MAKRGIPTAPEAIVSVALRPLMNNILGFAAAEIRRFLESTLPSLGTEWWKQHVVDRLTFPQQRAVTEHGLQSLADLDLAALLRVLDQNWYELTQRVPLPREARSWVRELQTVRNKWAHASARPAPASETYRDVDTIGRLLAALGTTDGLERIEARKAELLRELAPVPANTATPAAGPTTLFSVGDLVTLRSNPSTTLPVIEVVAGAGETRYRVFENGAKATYYESQLQAIAPADTLARMSAAEVKAYLTSLHLTPPSSAHLYSLRTGRINFVPYQYRPVMKLIRADRPRLLIADEVGVGKTIEAALILKELRARTDLTSVLVICPKALVAEKKWYRELKRFDEHFTSLDSRSLQYCLEETHNDGVWPTQHARTILPMSLLDRELLFGRDDRGRGRRRLPGLLELDPPPKFDLVIVDEAHHIRNPETFVHQAVRYFCDNAEAVVFLTATPVQLGSVDLYTLLNALRPDLIIDPASYAQMAEPNPFLHRAVQECRLAEPAWTMRVRELLDAAAQTEWGRAFLRERPEFQRAYDDVADPDVSDATRVSLVRRIEELGTFSGLINRTRRRDIGSFTTRKAETIIVAFTPSQQAFHDRLLDVIARILAARHRDLNVKFMMTTIRRQAASCLFGLAPLLDGILQRNVDRLEMLEATDDDHDVDLDVAGSLRDEITVLRDLASTLDPADPKLDAFLRSIRDKGRLPKNKALVFSTFRHTLTYLAAALERANVRYGLVHGDVPDEERAELRRRFAKSRDDADAIDVLLSSEVGSEGLDFQFCDYLVNYDLPWNPMRIEQRIGRLDRYGQESESVVILNLITPGTVDAEIYERCLVRIGVFQQAIGGNEEILGRLTSGLHDIAERFDLTPEERARKFAQLADNEIRTMQEQQDLEEKQAELFGLDIPRWREDIEAAETAWLAPAAVEGLVRAFLAKRLDTSHDVLLGEGPQKTLRLSQEARATLADDAGRIAKTADDAARSWDRWLKGASPTLPVTFDQVVAAENPSIAHLSLTHPLVRQAAAYFARTEPAEARLTVADGSIPASSYRFAIYRWTLRGVRSDERLVVVTDAPEIDDAVLQLLLRASDAPSAPAAPDEYTDLDVRHHAKWSEALANHTAENREQVEYRVRSLQASHAARRRILEDQIGRATNEKIQIMKRSERASADVDFERHIADLERAANAADIHAAPVLFGTLTVRA